LKSPIPVLVLLVLLPVYTNNFLYMATYYFNSILPEVSVVFLPKIIIIKDCLHLLNRKKFFVFPIVTFLIFLLDQPILLPVMTYGPVSLSLVFVYSTGE